MDKRNDLKNRVLTIHDYYDGLSLGVATLDGQACIYESDYLENGDSTLYYLTPIDEAQLHGILLEWERWIRWVDENQSAEGWKEEKRFDPRTIAQQSKFYRQYTRHATFSGGYENFHSHIDSLFVEWAE